VETEQNPIKNLFKTRPILLNKFNPFHLIRNNYSQIEISVLNYIISDKLSLIDIVFIINKVILEIKDVTNERITINFNCDTDQLDIISNNIHWKDIVKVNKNTAVLYSLLTELIFRLNIFPDINNKKKLNNLFNNIQFKFSNKKDIYNIKMINRGKYSINFININHYCNQTLNRFFKNL
jgi:hypothetical protein